MKLLGIVIAIVGMGLSHGAFAEGDKHEDNFEKMKANATEMIGKRIKMLQENQSCIQAATNRDGLRKCHEAIKEDRKELRSELMEKREERLKEREEKIKARKEKMEEKK